MPTVINFREVSIQAEMSKESIQAWLIEQVSRLTGLSAEEIDITEPFASYGLNSVAAAGLSGELADWLGEDLPPTITWDYPSVKLLAGYLASTLSQPCLLAA
ncbi:MAG TPA: acyl carrier protein [Candidatus Angelobacter sp.]|jgi:acyl carrier protein|nr:acyl carrier protein [Candidatus Angelobacter sp.]